MQRIVFVGLALGLLAIGSLSVSATPVAGAKPSGSSFKLRIPAVDVGETTSLLLLGTSLFAPAAGARRLK